MVLTVDWGSEYCSGDGGSMVEGGGEVDVECGKEKEGK